MNDTTNSTSINTPRVFDNAEFGQIRAFEIDGEVWFVGNDIATSLGYSNTRDAISKHVSEDDVAKRDIIDSLGRSQRTTIVNESGLYALIFGSALQNAKKFKKWVTGDVLPSIRRTGGYQYQGGGSTSDPIKLLAQGYVEVSNRVDQAEKDIAKIEQITSNMIQNAPVSIGEAEVISDAVKKKGVEICGGKKSTAYHDRSISQKVFQDIYREIHRNFDVRKYKLLKHSDVETCLTIIDGYEPPLAIRNAIRERNEEAAS